MKTKEDENNINNDGLSIFDGYFKDLHIQISAILETFGINNSILVEELVEPEIAKIMLTVHTNKEQSYMATIALDDRELACKIIEDLIKSIIVDQVNTAMSNNPVNNPTQGLEKLEIPEPGVIKLFDD